MTLFRFMLLVLLVGLLGCAAVIWSAMQYEEPAGYGLGYLPTHARKN